MKALKCKQTWKTSGTLERRLSVAVPMAEIDQEVDTRLKRLRAPSRCTASGPGKVPLKVVAQQYGPQVRQEVLGDAVQKSFGEAVREQNLRVAGYPALRAEAADRGRGRVRVQRDVRGLSRGPARRHLRRDDHAPAARGRRRRSRPHARDHAQAARDLRAGRARRRERRSRDDVLSRARSTAPSSPAARRENQQVVLGEGRLLPEFEAQLAGMKAGETKTFELRFPDDYHGKEVAGKTATFEVTVSEVAAPELPELDARIREEPRRRRRRSRPRCARRSRRNLEREVKARLEGARQGPGDAGAARSTKVEVPKALVEAEIERLRELTRQDLAARGMPVKDDTPLPAEMFEKQAQRRVNSGSILAELVKAHQLAAEAGAGAGAGRGAGADLRAPAGGRALVLPAARAAARDRVDGAGGQCRRMGA